jgi:N-acetylglucosamine kinase-like BadF-type ATPase
LSGGPADKDALVSELIHAQQVLITHDALIALAGATGGGPGIVTIAGTGSIAFGRNASGRTARAGGWGYLFGDEGGAFDLVRHALRAALRHEEGWGPATALGEVLLAASGSPDVNHLMHRFYSDEYPRDRIAALAPLVNQAASEGDPIAREILNQSAQALASITAAVRVQLFAEGETADVRYAGGVFRSQSLLARYKMLVEMGGDSQVSAPRYSPAAGALIEAYRMAGVECTLKNVPEE